MLKKNTIVYSSAFLILFSLLIIGLCLNHRQEKAEQQHQYSIALSEIEKVNTPKNAVASLKWSSGKIKALGIEVKSAGPGQLKVLLASRGKIILHPDYLAYVVPGVSGIAKEIRKNLGDEVLAGEVIVVLESREIEEAKANYLSYVTKEKFAKASLEREIKLYKKGISTRKDYLDALNGYEESKINLQIYKQKLQAYGLNEEKIYSLTDENENFRLYEVKAPIDGTIIKRHISFGEFIQGVTTIFEVANLKKVWVEMWIYPQDLFSIKENQLIEIVAPIENQTGTGKVVYVSPVIDEETLLIKAIAELENPEEYWRAGTFVNIKIATDQVTAPLVVPKEAIQNMDVQPCVFVLTAKGIERRLVKIGRNDKTQVELLSGMEPGEKYLANKTYLVEKEWKL